MTIPPVYAEQLERLTAGAWRERKQAVATLRRLVSHDREHAELMTSLARRLLDGLLSPDELDGRAACHEVLVEVGEAGVSVILERLASPGPARRLLVDLLGEIGDPSQADLFARIVADAEAEENLRASAAHALGQLGRPEDFDKLAALLSEESDMLRTQGLDALRSGEYQVPLPTLAPLIERPFTRKAAAALAGRSGDIDALDVLIPLLDDSMAGVRAVAAEAIVDVSGRADDAGRDRLAAAIAATAGSTRDHLCELVRHPRRSVRAAAIRLAALAREPGAVAPLLEVMDDPLIQEEGLSMMIGLGPVGVEALVSAGDEAVGGRREHVLRLAGALPANVVNDRLLALVTQGLVEAAEDTAVAAAETLATIGNRTCMAELYRAMATPGRLGEASADALSSIVRRTGGEGDLDLIVGTAWPHDGELARNLCRVAGALGSVRYAPRLVALLGSTDVGVRVAAAGALGSVPGEHEGASALSFALTDEEAQVRAAACRSLGLLEAPQAVSALLSATSDESPLVRSAAVSALVSVDNPVALARLRAVIAEDPVPAVVVHAIAGLGNSGLEQDLNMLMSLCTSEDWEVVKAAARALVRFSQHRATAALLGLLGHDRWDVRWAAAEVLAERGDDTALQPLRQTLEAEPDPLVRQILSEAIERLERAS